MNKNIKTFEEHSFEEQPINEHGGSLRDLINPRIDQLVEYLQKYKNDLNQKNAFVSGNDTKKIENMWSYVINDIDLDSISHANRQGKEVRGEGENIKQRFQRSIKHF